MSVYSNGASATVEVVEAAPDRIEFQGALTFDTARRASEGALRILNKSTSNETIVVDCAGVQRSDSAGLAVLLDLLANAEKRGRKMQFANLPTGIRAAADISDSAVILGV